MDLDAGTVDEDPVRRIPGPCQRTENVFPDAALRPARKAIVERLLRPVNIGAVGPASTAFERKDDPAQNPPIIHALFTAHILRQ